MAFEPWVKTLAAAVALAFVSRSAAAGQTASSSCPRSAGAARMVVPAARPGGGPVNLCEGYALSATSPATGEPAAMTSGDFDGDGVPDLVVGTRTGSDGQLAVYRGNVTALWPYGAAAKEGPPPAFLPEARIVPLPEAPDFVAAGDFDADGHWDIVAARRGSDRLYLLRGDGAGGFHEAEALRLPGALTALIAGEVNRADGLTDLVVAVRAATGPQLLVYESAAGALHGAPEALAVPDAVDALALGRFDGEATTDIAAAAGTQLVVVHGRDRQLTSAAARVTTQALAYRVQAMSAGTFSAQGPGLALLDDHGTVHFLSHAVSAGSSLMRAMDVTPAFASAHPETGDALPAGAAASSRSVAMRAALSAAQNGTAEWTETSAIALPAGYKHATPSLVRARVTTSQLDDLLVPDSGNNQVHVLSNATTAARTQPARTETVNARVGAGGLAVAASLGAASAPVALLPMRLGVSGLSGIVSAHRGSAVPALTPQSVPASNVFVVSNTLDITAPGQTPPGGSLRAAITAANNADGPASIVFDIPTSDPNYNAATGVFLIRPTSDNVAGSGDDFALPPILNTVTIDGYTQPGASPNTLTNGDNAKIVIQIDGSLATTPGGSGLAPYDDTGTVIRGFAFTGWTRVDATTQPGITLGGQGVEAHGTGDFIEGNFTGTNAAGTAAAPNVYGMMSDNGPLPGDATLAGNVIGGTTPQARNLISGNSNSGLILLLTSYEAQVQGNFIGTDVTGTKALSNTNDGVGFNGTTITIGGTLSGAGNVIAGNGTNVDINDIRGQGFAHASTVQGNLIGTDVTGTNAISGNGYGVSLFQGEQSMLIGGTSAAARNVIAGNTVGVYVYNDALYNTIEGNFIGADITGAKALGNTRQGVAIGATGAGQVPADFNAIGGMVSGAGNVISGNGTDGIAIAGHASGSSTVPGNTIYGNFIGTDSAGTIGLGNGGNGVSLGAASTNVAIGAVSAGAGNVIANNKGAGVLIDSATSLSGQGVNNITAGNTIASNSGAGVWVKSGTQNTVSRNSIYQNGALGIDIDAAGVMTNSNCNSATNGANRLQNYPVLTAGSGSSYITATATDPNGNTSEFSKAVPAAGTGTALSLAGNFNGAPSTTYTIEFFASPAADASGYGQGQTYLGSTTVTTDSSCTATISKSVDTTQADMSVNLDTNTYSLTVGDAYNYTATITNNGAATAHNVTFTDNFPAGLVLGSASCLTAACVSPVKTSIGSCTASSNSVTCNLGTMPSGTSATIVFPVSSTQTGTIADTATVQATESDPNVANNSSTLSKSSAYDYAVIDHISPAAVLAGSGDTPLIVYAVGGGSYTQVSFNSTTLPVTGVLANQNCGGTACTGLEVTAPAALLASPGTASVTAVNPGGSYPVAANFTIASACSYSPYSYFPVSPNTISNSGTPLNTLDVSVTTNVQSCTWTATSSAPWVVPLDNTTATGNARTHFAVAPNTDASSRSGSVTVAGQTFSFTQAGSATCSYAFTAPSAFAQSGGNGGVAVTTGGSCTYFPQSFASWITLSSGSGQLTGNGTVNFTVAPNPGAARTGNILIGGNVLTITQTGPSCYFTLSPASAPVPASGGSGSFAVTASGGSCAWSATASDAAVSITSGAGGTGNGTVSYSVGAANGGPATPTITIGNGTASAVFTIQQASPYLCTFTLTPASQHVSANGSSGEFTIKPSFSGCQWNTSSNNPSALAISGATSGTGQANITYVVAENMSTSARTLTLTAGCQTFTVTQDGTDNPAPVISSLTPSSVTAGSGAFTLTVNGANFVSGAVVNLNGSARTTTFVSSSQLTVAVLASDVASQGSVPVTVSNPAPGGGISGPVNLTVNASTNPVPSITSLSPTSVTAGSGAFTLTVNGTNFISSSTVNVNGNARPTTFVSATQLTAALPAGDIATAGNVSVTVTNPAPAGGTSGASTLTVNPANNPTPAITSLSPSSVTVGTSSFTLTVNGSNFISGSVASVNGSTRATTFVSATQVNVAVLASDVASAGTVTITVVNPSPGGGASNAVPLTVNNPAPSISSLSPVSVVAGTGAFTLTVNGTGFVAGSQASVNGSVRSTAYVSATQLSVALTSGDVANAGTDSITVTNTAPGGGTSAAATLTVTTPAAPAVMLAPSGLTFASTVAGTTSAAQTVTLTNSGNATLSLTGVSITGSGAAAFAQTNNCGATLTMGASCTISVTFSPAAAGSYTATISVADNAAGSPQMVTLSGTGTASANFSLSSSPSSLTLNPGAAGQVTITAAAQGGTIANAIVLSISGVPAGVTATFSPMTIAAGSASGSSVLTLKTSATMSLLRGSHFYYAGFGLLLLPWLARRKRMASTRLAVIAGAALAASLTLAGCGGGFYGKAPQTYTLTVTGTDGATQHTTTINLTVE